MSSYIDNTYEFLHFHVEFTSVQREIRVVRVLLIVVRHQTINVCSESGTIDAPVVASFDIYLYVISNVPLEMF